MSSPDSCLNLASLPLAPFHLHKKHLLSLAGRQASVRSAFLGTPASARLCPESQQRGGQAEQSPGSAVGAGSGSGAPASPPGLPGRAVGRITSSIWISRSYTSFRTMLATDTIHVSIMIRGKKKPTLFRNLQGHDRVIRGRAEGPPGARLAGARFLTPSLGATALLMNSIFMWSFQQACDLGPLAGVLISCARDSRKGLVVPGAAAVARSQSMLSGTFLGRAAGKDAGH